MMTSHSDSERQSMNLYDLTDRFNTLRQLADSSEPEELGECFHKAFGEAELTMQQKFEACCMVIRELEAIEEARCAEAARLRERARHASNGITRIKSMMMDSLRTVAPDTLKIKAGIFDVSICKNGGAVPVIINGDVPDTWTKATILKKPDMDLIRHELEKGHALPFAILENRGTHVRIR